MFRDSQIIYLLLSFLFSIIFLNIFIIHKQILIYIRKKIRICTENKCESVKQLFFRNLKTNITKFHFEFNLTFSNLKLFQFVMFSVFQTVTFSVSYKLQAIKLIYLFLLKKKLLLCKEKRKSETKDEEEFITSRKFFTFYM